jgi:hypothetical protein
MLCRYLDRFAVFLERIPTKLIVQQDIPPIRALELAGVDRELLSERRGLRKVTKGRDFPLLALSANQASERL